MLRILGSPKRLCSGLTRREMLRAGGLGLVGLGLPDLLRIREVQASRPARDTGRHFGKAKSCILLFLYGSPSQLETFDPKPDAPVGIRGELGVIPSNVPGLNVGELLPTAAKVMDRVTVVRSVTHPYPIHGVAYATTGIDRIDVGMELSPRDARHYPYIGSVVDYLDRRKDSKARRVPCNIALPFPFSSQRVGEVPRAGPYAAFLGGAYNPLWTGFKGEANRRTVKTLAQQTLEVAEPYMGVTPDSRFHLTGDRTLPGELTLDRLDTRRSLVEQFEQARRELEASDPGRTIDRYRQMAFNLIGSDRIRQALDLGREPLGVRESYGMTLFGQACVTARRLVEAGSRFISVFWDEFGLAGSAWDTHWEHYPRMKNELMPGLDRALYGLMMDLDSRGMLDETLVLLLSEHGRTPQLHNVKGGGRDHWSRAYSVLLAGGGVARGKVVGKTDRIAGDVSENPVSPKDILATAYHLLGIDPETQLTDRLGRTLPLVPDGRVLGDVLA